MLTTIYRVEYPTRVHTRRMGITLQRSEPEPGRCLYNTSHYDLVS